MPSVYVETTIPSYLAAKPSRDLVTAAHLKITHRWWNTARKRFDLFVSETVMAEIEQGDPHAVARRRKWVRGLPRLALRDDVITLANQYAQRLGLPKKAAKDLVHIAFAVSYETDYLLTWNCLHIANGEVIRRLRSANEELGRWTPLIVTPEELLEPI